MFEILIHLEILFSTELFDEGLNIPFCSSKFEFAEGKTVQAVSSLSNELG